MNIWALIQRFAPGQMYNSFTPLNALKDSAFRIFDPFAYKLVHTARMVPVGLHEATHLARMFPIVWVPNMVGNLRPVVILRASSAASQNTVSPAIGLGSLPALLQAYPFRFKDFETQDTEVGLERVLPEHERDSGSYIFDQAGELLPGALLKMSALEHFIEGYDTLLALTARLTDLDLFEPVRIPDEFSVVPPFPEMFAALEDVDLTMVLNGMAEEAMPEAIDFVVAQRLSLYRMHRLLKVAGKSLV